MSRNERWITRALPAQEIWELCFHLREQNNNHWEWSAPESIKQCSELKSKKILEIALTGFGCTNYLPLAKHSIKTSFGIGRQEKVLQRNMSYRSWFRPTLMCFMIRNMIEMLVEIQIVDSHGKRFDTLSNSILLQYIYSPANSCSEMLIKFHISRFVPHQISEVLFCFGHLENFRGSLWKSVEQ